MAAETPAADQSELVTFVRQATLEDGTSIELGGIAWSEGGPFALLNGQVVGLGEPIAGLTVVIESWLNDRSSNEMRGRVSAVNSLFIGSSNELGGFESGLVARVFGPVVSVVSGGIGTLLVVAGWTVLFPSLRRFQRLSGRAEDDQRTP